MCVYICAAALLCSVLSKTSFRVKLGNEAIVLESSVLVIIVPVACMVTIRTVWPVSVLHLMCTCN